MNCFYLLQVAYETRTAGVLKTVCGITLKSVCIFRPVFVKKN